MSSYFGRLQVRIGSDVQRCTCGAYTMDSGCSNPLCMRARHMLKEPLVVALQIKGARP